MPEGVCPRLVPEGRADLQFNWPTQSTRACADLKAMPVGRVNAAPIARPLCRSRVRPEYRAGAARQASSACGNRQPGAEWGTAGQYAGVLPGSRRVTNADFPDGRDESSWERALTWACRLAAGAIDRRGGALSVGRGSRHTCGRLPCCSARQARGARVVGRRTVGNAAQLARVRLNAPLGCRGCWSLVAVCAAPPQKLAQYWCTCGSGCCS